MANETEKSNGLDASRFNSILQAQSIDYGPSSFTNKLFGLPHQFLSTADYRIDNSNEGTGLNRINKASGMGRKFLQEIIAEAPILTIIPGNANFLPDYSKADKSSFSLLAAAVDNNGGDDAAKKALKDLVSDNAESRYFEFVSDYSNYINYVNLLCRVTAILMGLGDKKMPGTNDTYRKYDWGNYKFWKNYKAERSNHKTIFDEVDKITETIKGTHQYLSFYVDPSTSFSESTSNDTSKSQIESKFESMEGIVKELSFFANSNALKDMNSMVSGTFTSVLEGLENMGSDEGFFKNLFGRGKEIVNGSNLIFPEIWGDSAYNKSYTVNMELTSPYGDKHSIYLNVFVPMMHVLALALPKQTTANAYAAPFIVKMFAKGWFSCEMGIIDSLQIEKAPEQAWSVDGLPTSVKITMSVKDLYSNLMMSPSNKPSLFFANQGMMEFLCATCGVDLSRSNIELKVQIGLSLFASKLTDIVPSTSRKFLENISTKLGGLLS